MAENNAAAEQNGQGSPLLFWGCFAALVATAFGFVVRGQIINDWGTEFGLNETQKGEIFGVGLWPFAISIVLFSLVIDRIGYGKAMIFAFVCHVASAIVTIFATGYWSLYVGTFIVALGNGTVEAVINPVVASMYPNQKTKWLSILHAGWPGGLVLGGIIAIGMGDMEWQYKVGLIFIPVVAYAVLLVGRQFPLSERVQAGVSDRAMLQEAGILSAVIVVGLIVRELGRVFAWDDWLQLVVGGALVAGYGAYVRSLGRPIFVLLVLIMIPLATTELGTDSWITPLMEGQMEKMELHPGWVLVYTSLIMMVLRLFAGPIVHGLSPLALLALSSLVAAGGLFFLSTASGMMILVAATIYGFGKTFFWPVMLGVVAEQFPKGGAMTLNTISGVGMLSVGVIGLPFLGFVQDSFTDEHLQEKHPTVYEKVVEAETKSSVFGDYVALDGDKVAALPAEEKAQVVEIQEDAKRNVLKTATVLPIIMLVCYIGLILYFKSRGGYQAEVLTGHAAEDEKFTGGTEGAMEA